MADTAFSELNQKQKRMVALYTTEANSKTYLNRVESYLQVYKRGDHIKNKEAARKSAYHMFRNPKIQAAIKELLPTNAYDALFIRNEYLEHYREAKDEGSRRDCLAILKEMAIHEGMIAKSKEKQETKELDKFEKQAKEAQMIWNEQLAKMNAGKAV